MSLAFLIDETCERSLGQGLRDRGFDVAEIAARSPSVGDDVVSSTAHAESLILVTYDWGFGERAVRDGFAFRGLVIGDLGKLRAAQRVKRMLDAIEAEGDALEGLYLIVGRDRLRRRLLRAL